MGGQPPPTEGAAGDVGSDNKTNDDFESKQPSYSEMSRRRFPNITIDLEPKEAGNNQRLTFSVIGDIIFDHLRLKRGDFMKFQVFREDNGRNTLKVRTVRDIDVKKMYGDCPQFEIHDGNADVTWRATVRGVSDANTKKFQDDTVKLRIFNPPEEAAYGEIENEVAKFAVIKTRVREEVVTAEEDPRLEGCPTGVLNVRIKKPEQRVPRTITVRGQNIRIHVALHPNRCLKCYDWGHRVAQCGDEEGDDQKIAEPNGQTVETENGLGEKPENLNGDQGTVGDESAGGIPRIVEPGRKRGARGGSRDRGRGGLRRGRSASETTVPQ